MATMEGKIFPKEIYLAKGGDGKGHCYLQDPMKVKDRASVEVDFADTMFGFFGDGDPVNPVVLHVSGVAIERGEAFDISMPGKVRAGVYDGHFEDMEGNVVEVLSMRSPDPLFPINGIVLDRDGRLVTQRLYDGSGRCSDGEAYHRLVVIKGAVKDAEPEGRNGEDD